MQLQARPSGPLSGAARPPGDKSISHRALILGAMAEGVSEIDGLLEGDDVLRTADAARAFGAHVERLGGGRWRVTGKGGFTALSGVIDCGNSGTGVRLLMGAAAGFPISATFTGDASLRARPMRRVLAPLGEMGLRFADGDGERLPLALQGGGLRAIRYTLPVASAQVKSAILLAGLNAEGETEVIEPERTRDHTEKMLAAFGAELSIEPEGAGRRIRLRGGQKLKAVPVSVPADPSSAAFPIVAALITPGSDITLESVLLNPLRTGLFDTLVEMGGDITIGNERESGGERIGDVRVRASALKGVVVPPERAPAMIDEYPILAVAAAFAEGETIMRGIGEMRVKESDRIALTVAGLRACGVEAEEEPEGMIVRGTGAPPAGGANVSTSGDHRIAMAHLVLGLAARAPVIVDEAGMIETSFPDFPGFMRALGADIAPA
ncbi:MAG: 3-phosphoshikimate 1-carboxyvinyltransferase [Hyphomonadaceae bacterium]